MHMLSRIVKLSLVFVLLLPCSLFSQEHYFGVKGAYGMSSIRFQPFRGDRESVSGMDFGIAYKLYAEKYMGTQIELNRVQRGYKLTTVTTITDATTGAEEEETTITTSSGNAIELPMMAQGNLRFGGFRILVNAGVFGSYMLSQEQEVEVHNDSGISVSRTDGFSDRDRRFEYGILGGGGFAFQLKKVELQVEARYQYSLGYAIKPRFQDEAVSFVNRSHLAFSVTLFYNL